MTEEPTNGWDWHTIVSGVILFLLSGILTVGYGALKDITTLQGYNAERKTADAIKKEAADNAHEAEQSRINALIDGLEKEMQKGTGDRVTRSKVDELLDVLRSDIKALIRNVGVLQGQAN